MAVPILRWMSGRGRSGRSKQGSPGLCRQRPASTGRDCNESC
ncbi:Hypothetical protein EPM1_2671 [Stenotrophomonas maltophilia EPM1]|nr:Hypothetical protein EPM1_2671 [Stenotrophomonas maltophilia EPM1]